MWVRFRTALMWLLLLALPLQGFAAATMIHCGPNHHRMASAVSADMAELADMADTADMPAAYEHASHDHDTVSVHDLDTLTKFKCSACAACCMAAALPTASLTIEAFPPAIVPDTHVLVSRVGHVTDGPDRPPRPSLV